MDSPALASDNIKERGLVLLLVSVGVSFAWGKEELNKSVPGAVHLCAVPYTGPVTAVSGFCIDGRKACMVTASNTVVEHGVKSE